MIKFIAEVSSNHSKNLSRCILFIKKASEIGCSAVKFQLFKIDELFAPEILAKSKVHSNRRSWELPVEFLPELAQQCKNAGIQFSCTPFYLQAVDELFPYVDFYKIASYELLWEDLLIACAQTGKPVVLSTGMAVISEVQKAVDTLRSAGCKDLTLLHCVSGYPAPPVECNLASIETLRDRCNCPVGWSDHSVSAGVIFRAVHRWGASIVEFHLDLEGEGAEFKTGHCWLPEQIKVVIQTVQAGYHADGNGQKEPAPSEITEREWRADPGDGRRPLLHLRSNFMLD